MSLPACEVERWVAYAASVGHVYARRYPSIDRDDWIGHALLTLTEAAHDYDPERSAHVDFRRFLIVRLNQRLTDHLRAWTHYRADRRPVRVRTVISLDAELADEFNDTVPLPSQPSAEDVALDGEVDLSFAYLTAQEHDALTGNLAEAGRRWGVTESRMSQVRTGAREKVLARTGHH